MSVSCTVSLLTDAKVSGSLLNQRVHLFLGRLLRHEWRSGDLLGPLDLLLRRLKDKGGHTSLAVLQYSRETTCHL